MILVVFLLPLSGLSEVSYDFITEPAKNPYRYKIAVEAADGEIVKHYRINIKPSPPSDVVLLTNSTSITLIALISSTEYNITVVGVSTLYPDGGEPSEWHLQTLDERQINDYGKFKCQYFHSS